MFTFISTGGVVDKEINKGNGPYVFRMHGQNYHHIGTLLPEEGNNHVGPNYTYMTLNMKYKIELRHQKMVERVHQLIQ
jgi:hypothetical protein